VIRTLLAIIATTIPLVVGGCAENRKGRDVPSDATETQVKIEVQDQLMTAEAAKQALLDMSENQIPSGVLVPKPKEAPIEFETLEQISIGIYECNLKTRTFHATATYPKAYRHQHNEVSGVFERREDGKWVAKVTQATSMDAHPKE